MTKNFIKAGDVKRADVILARQKGEFLETDTTIELHLLTSDTINLDLYVKAEKHAEVTGKELVMVI